MTIGSSFNNKCFDLLRETARISNNNPGVRLSVSEINKSLNFEREEISKILEYLNEIKLLKIETIGGPLLYGHISITKKGVKKIEGAV